MYLTLPPVDPACKKIIGKERKVPLHHLPKTNRTHGIISNPQITGCYIILRLALLGVLGVANNCEWGSPSFAQPKPKSNRLHFLSNFRNLNKQLKRKLYPMPKIKRMLLKLEGFQYSTSLYLNMGYYHI